MQVTVPGMPSVRRGAEMLQRRIETVRLIFRATFLGDDQTASLDCERRSDAAIESHQMISRLCDSDTFAASDVARIGLCQ
jgi:hypothetical protein